MATLSVTPTLSNVPNGTFVVRVELLNGDGGVVAVGQSDVIHVTGNPGPTVGVPTVTVS